MALKILLVIIAFSLPLFIGSIFKSKSIPLTYLIGSLTMWALFQLIAVPAVLLRSSFTLLFWIYTGLVVIFTAVGIKCRIKVRFKKPEISVWLVLALLVFAYQAGKYIFGMNLDEDDARWLAEANDALVKDKMLLHNPATGEYIGRFVGEMRKDIFSPWAFFIAWLSRITNVRAAVMAHTVYPPVLLGLCYCAYYLVGENLFKGKAERGIFLLMVSLVLMFMAGNSYVVSVRILVRIWQGKTVVPAILIPAISALVLIIQTEDHKKYWIMLIITSLAGCLMSGIGIAIGLIMIGVYGGYIIVCKRWKRIPYWILSMLPPIIYGAGYFFIMRGS